MVQEQSSEHDRQDAEQHQEGPVARAIEDQTAKIPSDCFLWTAGLAVLGSLGLQAMGRQKTGNFVAQWVPTILILGLYNKLVKVQGHDRAEHEDEGEPQAGGGQARRMKGNRRGGGGGAGGGGGDQSHPEPRRQGGRIIAAAGSPEGTM